MSNCGINKRQLVLHLQTQNLLDLATTRVPRIAIDKSPTGVASEAMLTAPARMIQDRFASSGALRDSLRVRAIVHDLNAETCSQHHHNLKSLTL